MPHDQQAIEQPERDCRHHEQVHRGDAIGMIAEERLPALGRRAPSLCHVLRDGGLPDLNAELEELTVDPGCAPQRIGNAHLADQPAYLERCLRPTPARR